MFMFFFTNFFWQGVPTADVDVSGRFFIFQGIIWCQDLKLFYVLSNVFFLTNFFRLQGVPTADADVPGGGSWRHPLRPAREPSHAAHTARGYLQGAGEEQDRDWPVEEETHARGVNEKKCIYIYIFFKYFNNSIT